MGTIIKKTPLVGAILLASVFIASGQKFSLATNGLGYLNFLTLNAEFGMAVDKKWSISVSGKYNPFSYNSDNPREQMQNKQLTLSTGARYWPFYVFSGFFYGAKMQYSRYNRGGIFEEKTTEGDAGGIGFNFGYSLLLSKWLNIEFGGGFWTGGEKYTTYACPRCGRIVARGSKFFFAPNDLLLNVVFTF